MDKKEMRKLVSARLQAIDRPAYEHHSFLIARTLFSTEQWKQAKTVAVTVSRFPEVDTWQLIRKGWEQGKRMAVPKCHPASRGMTFHILGSFDRLEAGYSGLFEPDPETTEEAEKEEIDLLIIPGLAFTEDGQRLGFGGGYYDRYLENFKGRTLALAFTDQIVDRLPTESHDKKVPFLITEQGVLKDDGV